MSDRLLPPAKNPCGSCPYRCDVASGVWHPEEYAKLPEYDRPLAEQPTGMFLCHQQDGSVCAGWAGTHDMLETLAVRLAVAMGHISVALFDRIVDYTTSVPLFGSGREAMIHGMRNVADPDDKARRTIAKIIRKQTRGE